MNTSVILERSKIFIPPQHPTLLCPIKPHVSVPGTFSFPLPFRLSLLCFPAPSRASVIAMWTQGNCQFSDRLGALGRQPGPNPLRTDRIMPCVILQHRFLGHSGGTRSQAVSSLATPRSPGNTDSWGGGGEGCTWASFTWRHPWVSISFPGDPSQRPAL